MKTLLAPLPRGAVWLFAAAALFLFALAWLALRYPLTYCDSPGWAPGYVSALFGQPIPPGAALRSATATAFFDVLGAAAARFYLPGLIGFAQGAMLLAAVLALVRVSFAEASRLSLVLLPALLASTLRHAVYAQTLLGEPLAIALLALVVPAIVRPRGAAPRAFADGALAAVLAAIRLDFAYVVPLVLARRLVARSDRGARGRLVLAALLGAIVAAAGTAGLERWTGRHAWPSGRIAAVAEWSAVTTPPRNSAARSFDSPLVRAVAAAESSGRFRTINEALPAAQAIVTEQPGGWGAVAGLMLRDLVNDPARVLAHRAAVLEDLFASGYASFWPERHPRSASWSGYPAVFSGWTVAELDGAAYSPCSALAIAQREYFHATGVARDGACALLLALHRVVTPYAVFVWRPLVWLAVPAFLLLVVRRRSTGAQRWLALLLGAHFLLRAMIVNADERYELPVDLLLLGWTATVLSDAVRALLPASGAVEARNVSSPRR